MLTSVELASRYTSYVAVDPKEQTSLKESLIMMKSRDVPNTLAHGWGGHGLQTRAYSMLACGKFEGPWTCNVAWIILVVQLRFHLQRLRLQRYFVRLWRLR